MQDILIRHTAVKDDGNPVKLVHVIGGHDGGVDGLKEIHPFRVLLFYEKGLKN